MAARNTPPLPGVGGKRRLAYATRVRFAPVLSEVDAGEFIAKLDNLTRVYAAAMAPPPQQLPSRRAIMERHAAYAGFRAVVATAGQSQLIGFAYGFHGEACQWWHDLVSDAMAKRHGSALAQAWLGDSFEIAEVHVQPEYQGHGTGHAMLLRLTRGRPERTAVLSTMDADTTAHRLYHRLGFADLLPGFIFPGADMPYTIMAARLPLPDLARIARRLLPSRHCRV